MKTMEVALYISTINETYFLDVIILAGGMGTRLQSVLPDQPKPLAPIHGKPFLDYLLRRLDKEKLIQKVILATGYKSLLIQEYYSTHPYHFKIDFSFEQSPLGTGGAARLALENTQSDFVLILNGDSFVEFDLEKMFLSLVSEKNAGVILLTKVLDGSRFGTVKIDLKSGKILSFLEKVHTGTSLINAGAYLLSRNALFLWPREKRISMENEILPFLLAGETLYGYVVENPFIDIGTPDSYRQAEDFFKADVD
ncbi:MAG: NTP transferase domain-containing protein [Deltaproteobacteria bacterium]|nr:MAG: NTP transferase domain-containing protein [Deltaproteobacteria bacterium]